MPRTLLNYVNLPKREEKMLNKYTQKMALLIAKANPRQITPAHFKTINFVAKSG
jgi:sulfur relay (sulfurtransferase) DsrC/TusE family protein